MHRYISPLILSGLIAILLGCQTSSNNLTSTSPTPPTSPTPTEIIIQPLISPTDEVSPTPTDSSPTIAYGDIQAGRLESAADVANWTFEAEAGERVNLVLNSEFDSYLELYAPDGELIASGDDSGNRLDAALFEVLIKRSGLHTIAVRGYNGAMGNYALALTGGHPTAGGGALAADEPRVVMLSPQGLKWTYAGQKDTYLSARLQTDRALNPSLALYGPDGTLLARSNDNLNTSTEAEIFEFQLPEDGLYTLQAQSRAETDLATLSLSSAIAPSGGGQLTPGQTQTGTLYPGRVHYWTFTGEAGRVINLSMASEQFDTFLELRDSQEAILAENDDSHDTTNSTIELFTLPTDDSYSVIARGLSETDGGDYEITLKPTKVTPGGGSLLPDTPAQALLRPQQTDIWHFEADANSFVTIKTESDSLDTYLELYGPDNQLLTEDDDSGGDLNAAILDFPIKEAGLYQAAVRVAQEGSDDSGVYEITLTASESLEITGQLVSGEPQKGRLEVEEQHSWLFQAEEDYYVTIKMESPALDTYLSLYNSQGTLLAVNDDFLGRQAVIANFIVPADGEYRVVARAYSTKEAGDYTISLDITLDILPLRSSPATSPKEN